MDKLTYPVSQVAQWIHKSEDELKKYITPVIVDSVEYIDIAEVNKLLVNKTIKYNFSKINEEQPRNYFCKKRKIE